MYQLKNKKGFTLIEIVIVLAIAALILVGVLLAVQGAQRSRRDTARKDFASRVGSYLESSASNNSGNYPSQAGGQTLPNFNTAYVTNQQAPDGGTYPATSVGGTFGTCPGSGQTANSLVISYNGTRQWQVAVGLETGDAFCARSN